jgi:hypothetical protein
MRVGLAFATGMIGWAVMVSLTILLRAIRATELNLCMIVGSLFTGQVSTDAWTLGFIAGLIVSGVIALVYAGVFEGLRRSGWQLGLVGGAIHTAVAGVFFAALSAFHPAMPDQIAPPGPYAINYGVITTMAFVASHLLFGVIVGGTYKTVHIPTPPSRLQPTPEEHAVGAGGRCTR